MAHYHDLSPCNYFGEEHASVLKAVGWLEADHPYPKGTVNRAFFETLLHLLKKPWNPFYFGGFHRCSLCRSDHQFSEAGFPTYGGHVISPNSAYSLFVPGSGCVYVTPSNIVHYIDIHFYQPPEEFREAVLNCPEMRSAHYYRLLLNNGLRGLVKLSMGKEELPNE
jgi:hypothetical protein